MNEDEKRPWFSWAHNMPKPVILALALLCNLNILGFGCHNAWGEINTALNAFPDISGVLPETLARFGPAIGNLLLTLLAAEGKELTAGPPIARLTGIVVLLQLNTEAIYMILTMRRNHWEKEQAEAKGIAKGKALAEAEAAAKDARLQEWYESYKDKMQDIPPPPFLNGKNGDSGYAR